MHSRVWGGMNKSGDGGGEWCDWKGAIAVFGCQDQLTARPGKSCSRMVGGGRGLLRF